MQHWHILVCELDGVWIINGSDNGLSSVGRQAIIWANGDILSIRPRGTYFSEVLFQMKQFSLMKMHLKMTVCKNVCHFVRASVSGWQCVLLTLIRWMFQWWSAGHGSRWCVSPCICGVGHQGLQPAAFVCLWECRVRLLHGPKAAGGCYCMVLLAIVNMNWWITKLDELEGNFGWYDRWELLLFSKGHWQSVAEPWRLPSGLCKGLWNSL